MPQQAPHASEAALGADTPDAVTSDSTTESLELDPRQDDAHVNQLAGLHAPPPPEGWPSRSVHEVAGKTSAPEAESRPEDEVDRADGSQTPPLPEGWPPRQIRGEVAAKQEARRPRQPRPKRARKPRLTRQERRARNEAKRQAKPRRDIRDGHAITYVVWALILIPLVVSFIALRSAVQSKTQVRSLVTQNKQLNETLKRFTVAGSFPLSDAQTQALRLTRECFTFTNAGRDDQTKRLKAAGFSVDCGWNGLGNATVTSADVLQDASWIGSDHAVIAIQVQLYTQPGWFVYYVPFTAQSPTKAVLDGPGTVFGLESGASVFGLEDGAQAYQACPSADQLGNAERTSLAAAAQGLFNGLSGATNVDPTVYTAPGSSFGSFGSAIVKPVVGTVVGCGHNATEQFFTAPITTVGPGSGAGFTQVYAFAAEQVKAAQGERWVISRIGPYISK